MRPTPNTLTYYNFYAYPGTFLSDLSWSIGNLPTKEIVMPGTHDSSMYGMTSPMGENQTQWDDYSYQLANGARFFDFRVMWINISSGSAYDTKGTFVVNDSTTPVDGNGFYLYGHSTVLTGYKPFDVINTVESWLIANPNEVVILDLSDNVIADNGAANMSPQFAQLLAGTRHPDLIYTPITACGTTRCTNSAVLPQNMSINQLKASGTGYYGSRLILINPPSGLDAWAWSGLQATQVGYCNDGSGRSTASAELNCINNPNTSVSGSQSLQGARPNYEAAAAANQFMHLSAVLTPDGAADGGAMNGLGPLFLADGSPGDNYGFNNGGDTVDLNNQLSSGTWNINALNMVTIDGLGHDSIPSLLIARNHQTWVNKNFFNNTSAQPAGALSIGANGDIWAAGSGHSISIFKYNIGTAKWTALINSQPNVKKLAVDPQGGVWVVDGSQGASSTVGNLWHYDQNGQNGVNYNKLVQDVSAGADDSVWLIENGQLVAYLPPNGALSPLRVPTQSGSHVSVDNRRYPWVVDPNGYIQRFNGSGWQQVSGSQGKEIVAGADGSLFITGSNTPSIGRYNVQSDSFDFQQMDASHVAVEPGGQPWAIRTGTDAIYKGSLDQI